MNNDLMLNNISNIVEKEIELCRSRVDDLISYLNINHKILEDNGLSLLMEQVHRSREDHAEAEREADRFKKIITSSPEVPEQTLKAICAFLSLFALPSVTTGSFDSERCLVEKIKLLSACNLMIGIMQASSKNKDLDEMLDAAISERGRAGALAMLEKSIKQKAKAEVFECWQRWQKNPSQYKNKSKFARAMLDKYEALESQRTITDWCTLWEEEASQQNTLSAS